MKLGGLLESGAGALGPRVFLVGLLPVALGGILLLGLYWSGAPAQAPDLAKLSRRLAVLEASDGVLLGLAGLFLALALQPLQFLFVRLMEGYWGTSRLAFAVAVWLTERQRSRRRRLAEATMIETRRGEEPDARALARAAAAAERLQRRYPAEDRIMPTALGNALRAAEERAGGRYGLDAIVAWPRLYPLLSDRLAAAVEDQRNQLDFAVRLSWLMLLFAAVAAALLWRHPSWLSVPAIALLLSWLAYRAAVAAAVSYGVLLETAFDLHRFDLVKALALPLPPTLRAEREANARLSAFLREGGAEALTYKHE